MLKARALLATSLTAGALLGLAALPAQAATSYGAWGAFPADPPVSTYWGRGGVSNSPGKIISQTQASSVVSAGWLGGQARGIVQSTGALCRVGSWLYSASSASSWTVNASPGGCAGHATQSYSLSRGWRTSGSYYGEYWTNYSPALNL
jgi:hypothetical protein